MEKFRDYLREKKNEVAPPKSKASLGKNGGLFFHDDGLPIIIILYSLNSFSFHDNV